MVSPVEKMFLPSRGKPNGAGVNQLPGLGAAEDPQRGFLLAAYLRMWRGPRYTNEHVDNKYAGRIIQ